MLHCTAHSNRIGAVQLSLTTMESLLDITNPPVEAEDKSKNEAKSFKSNSTSPIGFPLDLLPYEILYLIIEKLDDNTFVNCLLVSRKWKSICLKIATADKTDQRWKAMFYAYHQNETYKVKSYKLTHKELFANLLRWNYDFSFSLHHTYPANIVKKINIYRDNIIVVDSEGVKYYDVHTHKLKRQLEISQCNEFIERDSFVLRSTQFQSNGVSVCKLFLYGKSDPMDDKIFDWIQETVNLGDPNMNVDNYIVIDMVNHYSIEDNNCYVLKAIVNTLACCVWRNKKWEIIHLGRFYGYRDTEIYAMNVQNTELFLLIEWGQMLRYSYECHNFQEIFRFSMPKTKEVFARMVHKNSIVVGVPEEIRSHITRIRNNDGYNFYRLECSNLSCVTQHGQMLILGFCDGKIQFFMPNAPMRDDMRRHSMHISDFTKGLVDPKDQSVVSIDVYEDSEKHYLFVATHSKVYQLLIEINNKICIWDNIPKRPVEYKYPIVTRDPQ